MAGPVAAPGECSHGSRHGTIHDVYPVLLIAAAAILAGVVVVAMGRGGELALVRRDVPEFRFRIRTPADVAMLRLPVGPLGYREPATSDALRAIAGVLAERDAEIASLRDQIALLSGQTAAGSAAAGSAAAGSAAAVPGDGEPDAAADEPGVTVARPAVPS